MLVISTQNWLILVKFAKKNPAQSAVFYWLFLSEVPPRNFPWSRPIFLRICPWKSREILLFFPRNIRSPVFICKFEVNGDHKTGCTECWSNLTLKCYANIFVKADAQTEKECQQTIFYLKGYSYPKFYCKKLNNQKPVANTVGITRRTTSCWVHSEIKKLLFITVTVYLPFSFKKKSHKKQNMASTEISYQL